MGVSWSLAFVAAAVAQYNDPDPWLWGGLYAVAALLALGTEPPVLHRASRQARSAWIVIVTLQALLSFWGCRAALTRSGVVLDWGGVFGPGGMMAAGVEEMREALGLAIVAARLGWLAFKNRRGAQAVR